MAMRRTLTQISNIIQTRKRKGQTKRAVSDRSPVSESLEKSHCGQVTTPAVFASVDTVANIEDDKNITSHHSPSVQRDTEALSALSEPVSAREVLISSYEGNDDEAMPEWSSSINTIDSATESLDYRSSMAVVLYDTDSMNDATEAYAPATDCLSLDGPRDLLRAASRGLHNDCSPCEHGNTLALVPRRSIATDDDEAYRSMSSSDDGDAASHADRRTYAQRDRPRQPSGPSLTFRGKDLFTLRSIHADIESTGNEIAHHVEEVSDLDRSIRHREADIDRQLEITGNVDRIALEDVRHLRNERERRSRAYDCVLVRQRDNWDDLRDFLTEHLCLHNIPPLSRASSRSRVESPIIWDADERGMRETRPSRGRTETPFSRGRGGSSPSQCPSAPTCPPAASLGRQSCIPSFGGRRSSGSCDAHESSIRRPIRLPMGVPQRDTNQSASVLSTWDLRITEIQVRKEADADLLARHAKAVKHRHFAQAVFPDRDGIVIQLWSQAKPAQSCGVPREALAGILEPMGQEVHDLSCILDPHAFRFRMISRLTRGLIEAEEAVELIEKEIHKSGLRPVYRPEDQYSNFPDRSDDGYRMSEEQAVIDWQDKSAIESWMSKFPRNPVLFADAITDASKVAKTRRRIDNIGDEWDGASLQSHEGYTEDDYCHPYFKCKIDRWRAAVDELRTLATRTRAEILGIRVEEEIDA